MRRAARSTLSAFAIGLFWATAGVGAFVGGLHVWAPPVPDSDVSVSELRPEQSRSVTIVADSSAVRIEHTTTTNQAAPPVVRRFGVPAAESLQFESQRVLTRGIQQELIRVGCYSGAIDGRWSDGTRAAMSEFNSVIGAKLPVSAPDYILLTMVQGHKATACAAKSAPIVAAKPVPRVASPKVLQPSAPKAAIETIVVAPQAPATWAQTTTQPHVIPPTQYRTTLTNALPAPLPVAQPAPLPGRMTVGAPTDITPSLLSPNASLAQPSAAEIDPLAATKAVGQPKARDSRQQASSGRASGNRVESGASRVQRTFSELNRNAP